MSALVLRQKRSLFEESAIPTYSKKKSRYNNKPTGNYKNPFSQPAPLSSTAKPVASAIDHGVNNTGAARVVVSSESIPPVNNNNVPKNGAEWVEFFVNEMTTASSIDDAKARTSRLLEVLVKCITTEANGAMAEAADKLHKEKVLLEEQMEELSNKYNVVAKHAVIIHKRVKEADARYQEIQTLQELVTKLKSENYTLQFHLNQAQQKNPLMDRFYPDVY
ncbi:hypothetical protein IFM89_000801 [Coptis chinensis]|uniref:Uncharacterized protein n=1 Tax=Coptis chinensis TaxID=261450 RepID=A0A835IW19_9MAGN|nr:hypothetical protein IFM89_000801 [Coptis chinensis]